MERNWLIGKKEIVEMILTGFEEDDGSEARVFGGINVHLLEFSYRLLEGFDFTQQTQLAFGTDGRTDAER